MPDGHAHRLGGHVADHRLTARIGARRPHRVGHEDEGRHAVMDVAADRHHAGLVERDAPGLVPGEKLQFEALGRREGIDMVLERIEVREGDRRVHRHDRDERMKLRVLLLDLIFALRVRRRRLPVLGIERHDHVGHGLSVAAGDPHGDHARLRGRRDQHGCRKNEGEAAHGPAIATESKGGVISPAYQRTRRLICSWVLDWSGPRPARCCASLLLST